MSKTVLAIDPGMSTGITLMKYGKHTQPEINWQWQIEGGLPPFKEWCRDVYHWMNPNHVTIENFSPRPGARSWKLEELEPIRIEGYAESVFDDITWRRPEQRKLIGSLPRTERFLQANDYWSTGTDVDCKDANDANSATMHALGFLRDKAHIPTIEMLIEYGEHMTEDLV